MTSQLLQAHGLKKYYPTKGSFLNTLLGNRRYVKAVDGVDFWINRGEIYGLAGESGCGKTTIARIVLGLIEPTEGQVLLEGTEITKLDRKNTKRLHKDASMVFQDPYGSLCERMKVIDSVAEPLKIHKIPGNTKEKVEKALEDAGIRPARAFLVRERVRLRVKIKSILTYEGIKPQIDHGLFTERGVDWLHSLALEPLESYLRVISVLNNEIKHLSRHLKELAEDDEDVRLLMTIPGIGYYTALLVISEIGDINRFSDGDKLCSYGGLVPSTHASGGIMRHGSITKEGSRWLRWVMVEAAMTHVHKYDTAITKAYHRIAERRGKQVATVAAARKLLMCCYAVLKNRQPYYDQA